MLRPDVSPSPRVRWRLLQALDCSRPIGAAEDLLADVLNGAQMRLTALDIRRELDALEKAGLVKISRENKNVWVAELTYPGISFVGYRSADIEGIDRPERPLGG